MGTIWVPMNTLLTCAPRFSRPLPFSVHVRSLVLNLSPQTRKVTDAVYNRYSYDEEKRQALTRWENRLRAIVAGRHGSP